MSVTQQGIEKSGAVCYVCTKVTDSTSNAIYSIIDLQGTVSLLITPVIYIHLFILL